MEGDVKYRIYIDKKQINLSNKSINISYLLQFAMKDKYNK